MLNCFFSYREIPTERQLADQVVLQQRNERTSTMQHKLSEEEFPEFTQNMTHLHTLRGSAEIRIHSRAADYVTLFSE